MQATEHRGRYTRAAVRSIQSGKSNCFGPIRPTPLLVCAAAGGGASDGVVSLPSARATGQKGASPDRIVTSTSPSAPNGQETYRDEWWQVMSLLMLTASYLDYIGL
jgi:hypothetical protein